MFRKPKQQVIDDATAAAMIAASNSGSALRYNSLESAMQQMIAAAVGAAVASIVEDVYSTEEFEIDIGIRE